MSKLFPFAVIAFLVAACSASAPAHKSVTDPGVTFGNGSAKWYTCPNGVRCYAGYACVKDGCQWVGHGADITDLPSN